MKTFSAKPADVVRTWYVIDASEAPLGRIATRAAAILIGKSKPMLTSHIDCGDYVVIINTDKLVATGNKVQDKKYYSHSGFPGGIKEQSLAEVLQRDSTKAVYAAIRGMLPVNKLRDGRLARLKLYKDDQHNNIAQQPKTLSMKAGKK